MIFPTLAHSSPIILFEFATCFLQRPWLTQWLAERAQRALDECQCSRAVSRLGRQGIVIIMWKWKLKVLAIPLFRILSDTFALNDTRVLQATRIWINQCLWWRSGTLKSLFQDWVVMLCHYQSIFPFHHPLSILFLVLQKLNFLPQQNRSN